MKLLGRLLGAVLLVTAGLVMQASPRVTIAQVSGCDSLLVNGDFEADVLDPGGSSTLASGWQISVLLENDSSVAYSGSQYLHGVQGFSALQSFIPSSGGLSTGDSVEIRFWYQSAAAGWALIYPDGEAPNPWPAANLSASPGVWSQATVTYQISDPAATLLLDISFGGEAFVDGVTISCMPVLPTPPSTTETPVPTVTSTAEPTATTTPDPTATTVATETPTAEGPTATTEATGTVTATATTSVDPTLTPSAESSATDAPTDTPSEPTPTLTATEPGAATPIATTTIEPTEPSPTEPGPGPAPTDPPTNGGGGASAGGGGSSAPAVTSLPKTGSGASDSSTPIATLLGAAILVLFAAGLGWRRRAR